MRPLVLVGLGLLVVLPAFSEPPRVLGPGRSYRPASEQTGKFKIVGSTTLAGIAAHWGTGFREFHPKAEVEVDCVGTETAFPQLAKDGWVLGVVSRPLTPAELDELERQTGRKHLNIDICSEGMAIIVHPDNPIAALTRSQLRELLSMPSQQATAPQPAAWGSVGLTGEWENEAVRVHQRATIAGSYNFIRNKIVGSGRTDRPATMHDRTQDLIAAVAKERGALGYCRWLAVPKEVKVVPIVDKEEEIPSRWSAEMASNPSYRLQRRLGVVAACAEDGKLPEPLLELLLFILSREGQEDVVKDGFTPLPTSALVEQFDKLGINLDR